MKVRQHLQSPAALTPVLRAPGVSFFSIVSILIVDVSGGGRSDLLHRPRGESRRRCSRHRYACKALPVTNHSVP